MKCPKHPQEEMVLLFDWTCDLCTGKKQFAPVVVEPLKLLAMWVSSGNTHWPSTDVTYVFLTERGMTRTYPGIPLGWFHDCQRALNHLKVPLNIEQISILAGANAISTSVIEAIKEAFKHAEAIRSK